MTQVQKIEKEITHLPQGELTKLRTWFEKFDAEIWDKQFEEDVKAGKLDFLAEKAREDFKKGRVTEL